jgi:hypothetical protein
LVITSKKFSSIFNTDTIKSHSSIRKNIFKYFSILNINSKMSNRKTPNFATQLFSDEKRDLICVKEKKQSLLFFPKFFATQKTFLNANIKLNSGGCLAGR